MMNFLQSIAPTAGLAPCAGRLICDLVATAEHVLHRETHRLHPSFTFITITSVVSKIVSSGLDEQSEPFPSSVVYVLDPLTDRVYDGGGANAKVGTREMSKPRRHE